MKCDKIANASSQETLRRAEFTRIQRARDKVKQTNDTRRLCTECLEWRAKMTQRTSREVRNRAVVEGIQGVAHTPAERRILEEELRTRSNDIWAARARENNSDKPP